MQEARFAVGESFPVQFVWQLPDGDYLRAIMTALVVDLQPEAEKYWVKLVKLVAGRQETAVGQIRPQEELARAYWAHVADIIGSTILIAYEADNGRPLHMRLSTLIGEHNFFNRYPTTEEE